MRNTLLALLIAFSALPSVAATLVVANKSDDTVDLIDLKTKSSRATIPTGHAPHEVAVSSDGRWAAVTNYGDRQQPGSSITLIDLKSRKVARTIDLGRHTRPHGVAWLDGTRVAVTTEGSGHLLVVDTKSKRIVSSPATGAEISHMVALAGRSRAFIANIGSGSVTVIDLEAGKKIDDIRTGDGAEGIGVTPDGKKVWVTNREADTLSVIDVASLRVERSIACPGFPIRIAFTPDGKHALVSSARSGELVRFDAASGREVGRRKLDVSRASDAARRLFGDSFGTSPVPIGLVISGDGKRAYVAATQSDVVVVADTRTLEVIDILKAGREPDGMALVEGR
jgi:YVTN family beta-propeller protein